MKKVLGRAILRGIDKSAAGYAFTPPAFAPVFTTFNSLPFSTVPPIGSATGAIVDLESEYQNEIHDVLTEYDERKKRRQSKIGEVVSTKNAKSISVKIKHMKYVPKYNALIARSRKIMAHDEEEKAELGDIVRIVPCRPRSRMKRHELIDIIRKPKTARAVDFVQSEQQS